MEVTGLPIGQRQEEFLAGGLACYAGGICLGRWTAVPLTALAAGLVLVLGAAVWLLRRQSRFTWLAFLALFVLLGAMRFTAVWQLPITDISHWQRQQVTVTGVVREEPRITQDKQGQWHVRYTIDAEAVRVPEQSRAAAGSGKSDAEKAQQAQSGRDGVKQKAEEKRASGGLYVYASGAQAKKEAAAVRIGDRLAAQGKIRSPHGYQDPGQIDTVMLLRSDGITASCSAGKASVKVTAVEPQGMGGLWRRVQRWLVTVRQHYARRMAEVMPREDAAAIFAMLFGGYNGIRPELVEAFTVTGIVHILSVSGSHISLLAAVAAGLGALLHLPRKLTAVLVVLVIALYSMLAGCVPPVLRAAIMGGLTFIALAFERERDGRRLLLLTGLFMLLWSPLLLFHISFQLSFAATAGLLFLAPTYQRWLDRLHLPRAVSLGLAVTISAQLATLPFLAWYFNQLSLSSLIANLVVVPIMEFMIVLGLLGGILAAIVPFLGKLVFVFDSLLCGLVYNLTRALAQLPASQIWVPSMGIFSAFLYYVILGGMVLPTEKKAILRQQILAHKWQLGSVCLVGVLFPFVVWLVRPAELQVHFVDVGQGDCAIVVTPHGHVFVFDTGGVRGGNFDVGARVDVPYLLHYGLRHVDAIFLTHEHEDHAAGCGAILHALPVDAVYTAGEGLAGYARSMGLGDHDPVLQKLHVAHAGEKLAIDGVTVEVLFAPSAPEEGTGNEASNVYRVSYGQASFLFTGDLIREQEEKLLADGIEPRSTVLKVGHHGSDTSSSAEFLQAVGAQWAVICVGADNGFGHPKPAVLERLQQAGMRVRRTDEDGAIVFHTDGKRMQVTQFARAER